MKRGDRVFFDGIEGEFIVKVNERESLVAVLTEHEVYRGGYTEPDYSEPVFDRLIVNNERLSLKPNDQRTEYIKKELQLKKKYRDLDKVLSEKHFALKKEVTDFEKKIEKVTGKNKSLENLLDFVDGKVSYYVIDGYEPELKTPQEHADDVADSYDRRHNLNQKLKLLTLFGNTKGDLTWNISRYSDGSGGGYDVFLFNDVEEAKVKLLELIEAKIEGHENALSKKVLSRYIEKYGFDSKVINDRIALIESKEEDVKLAHIAKLKQELADAEAGVVSKRRRK